MDFLLPPLQQIDGDAGLSATDGVGAQLSQLPIF